MGTFDGVELADVELHGPRVTLRRWRRDDADRVREVMQDQTMREFLALPEPYDEAAALEFVTRTGDEGRDEGTGLGCAVVDLDGRVVGSAALRVGDEPEVGYWIATLRT